MWLERAAVDAAPYPTMRMTRIPPFDSDEARRSLRGLDAPYPVHVLVADANARRASDAMKFHVWKTDLPPGSVAMVKPGVFVSTPEFLFLQAARFMPFEALIEFGYDLCALYTCRLLDGDYLELPRAVCTAERICDYLDGAGGAPGIQNARRAIPWVLDRSRSPRETPLAISMVLPRHKGGQGVKHLSLNQKIPLTDEEQRAAGKHYYEIDLYWSEGKLGLEYFGREPHEGPMRTLGDIRRESILASKGITVHGVTKTQAEDVAELERFAKLFINAQGARWEKPTAKHERAMRALLRKLYKPRAYDGMEYF